MTPIYDKLINAPVEDPKYLRWIRTLPCAVCGTLFRVEAAHTGIRGLGQTADDRSAIPLCFKHHDRRQPHSYHKLGPVKFCDLFGLDIPALVARLNTRPRIRIYAGLYVAVIDGEEFPLHRIEDGLQRSLRAAVTICRDYRREQMLARFR